MLERGGNPITLDVIDSDSTHAAMATGSRAALITITQSLSCKLGKKKKKKKNSHSRAYKHNHTHTHTQRPQTSAASFLPDCRPSSFPAFVAEEGVSG